MYYTIIILYTCAVQKVMTLVLSPPIGACVRVKFPVETYIYYIYYIYLLTVYLPCFVWELNKHAYIVVI